MESRRREMPTDRKASPTTGSADYSGMKSRITSSTMTTYPIRGQAPHLFYNHGPMSHMNFSTAISEEGFFQFAKDTGWKNAYDAHLVYGDIEMPTTWGTSIRLNNYEQHQADLPGLREKLEKLVPGERDKLIADQVSILSTELQNALEVPRSERAPEDWALYHEARSKIKVTHRDVAEEASTANKREALETAEEIVHLEFLSDIIDQYRAQLNFEYWRTRAIAETKQNASDARQRLFDADRQMKEADDEEARINYEKAWRLWADLCKEYPRLLDDTDASDITTSLQNYLVVLDRTDSELPDSFPLIELLELHGRDLTLPTQLRALIKRLVDIQAAKKAAEANAEPEDPANGPDTDDPVEGEPPAPEEDPAPADSTPTDPGTRRARGEQ